MTFNGKEVFTQETFSYSKAQVGDYVSQAVVDDAMDCLPPVCMSSACSQVGEPHSTRLDPDTGKYRNTYATFSLVYSIRPTALPSDTICWFLAGYDLGPHSVRRAAHHARVSLPLINVFSKRLDD